MNVVQILYEARGGLGVAYAYKMAVGPRARSLGPHSAGPNPTEFRIRYTIPYLLLMRGLSGSAGLMRRVAVWGMVLET